MRRTPLLALLLCAPAFAQQKPAQATPKPTPEVLSIIDQALKDDVPPKEKPFILERAISLAKKNGDRPGEAAALFWDGRTYDELELYSKAMDLYRQALPIQRELGDRMGEANTLANLGDLYLRLGQPAEALEHRQRELSIRRDLKDRVGEGNAQAAIGWIYYR